MADASQENLKNVLLLAIADGQVSKAEKDFILRLRARLGIDEDELAALVAEVQADRKPAPVPADPAAAREAITLLAEAAAADGTISQAERKFVKALAANVGMDEATVDAMLIDPEQAAKLAEQAEDIAVDIYAGFAGWDAARRREKLGELASLGRAAGVALLRILESYRAPDGMADALELKTLVAEQLGALGDSRAIYYLAQQVNIADADDDISSSALRFASAAAIGKLVGEDFSADQAGVEAARTWWLSRGIAQHRELII